MTPTATPLELIVDAAAYAFLAYAYPSDEQICNAAETAAELAQTNYLGALGTILAHNPGINGDDARLHLALHFAERVQRAAATGAEPRRGVLASGKPADAHGRDPEAAE